MYWTKQCQYTGIFAAYSGEKYGKGRIWKFLEDANSTVGGQSDTRGEKCGIVWYSVNVKVMSTDLNKNERLILTMKDIMFL